MLKSLKELKLAKSQLRQYPTTTEKFFKKKWNAKFKDNLQFQKIIGFYVADFASRHRGLIIEVDGDFHLLPSKILKDQRRDQFLKSFGWAVERFLNKDIWKNIEAILYYLNRRYPVMPQHLRSGTFSYPAQVRDKVYASFENQKELQ